MMIRCFMSIISHSSYSIGAITKFVAFYQHLKFCKNTQTFVYSEYRMVSATETTDITLLLGFSFYF